MRAEPRRRDDAVAGLDAPTAGLLSIKGTSRTLNTVTDAP